MKASECLVCVQATIQQPGEPERMLPIIRSDMPLCRNVFEAFLGSSSCTPSTRAAAVAGAVRARHLSLGVHAEWGRVVEWR